MHRSVSTHRGQKRVPSGVGVTGVCELMWVLETKPEFSEKKKKTNNLNCQAICLYQGFDILKIQMKRNIFLLKPSCL